MLEACFLMLPILAEAVLRYILSIVARSRVGLRSALLLQTRVHDLALPQCLQWLSRFLSPLYFILPLGVLQFPLLAHFVCVLDTLSNDSQYGIHACLILSIACETFVLLYPIWLSTGYCFAFRPTTKVVGFPGVLS